MKRLTAFFLAAVCALSLAACGSQKPSLDEVEQAISEGNVTVEDALEKGWITQEWVDEYTAQHSTPTLSKTEAGMIGDFTATTLSGEEFTKEQMADATLFVFLDPADSGAEAFYQALIECYEGVKENGAEILVCTKSENGNEMFSEAPFPVIHYNDSLKAATENHTEMITGLPNCAVWCVNGSFYSSWASAVDADSLAGNAASYVEIAQEISENADDSDNKAVVMG